MALAWSEVQPPSPSAHTINDFCDLGSRVLVAVGTSGLAYRSTDGGATWAAVTLAEANGMTGLAYDGSSVLVAVSVGGTNRIQRSTDGGQTWGAIAAPVVAGWQSVCWDPTHSKFIAVASSGAGNRTMSSTDGTTWTDHAAAAAKAWSWVAANASVVVAAAFGTGTQQIMTSGDGGATWTLQTHTSWSVGTGVVSQGSSGLAWSSAVGVFAIGALNGATYGIMTSPTGVTWTLQTIPNNTTNRCVSLVAAPALGCFLGPTVRVAGVNTILTATAAATWTALDPTIYRDWTASGWSAGAESFVSWDTSGHSPQTILLGLSSSLESLSPVLGTSDGGTVVTITGTGLSGVTAVTFGGTAAIDVVPAANGLTVTCITPAHAVGVVDVVVTGIGTLAGAFTYIAVTRVTPNNGSVLGGQAVTITGFGFNAATGVRFGTLAATLFRVVSNTTITCVTPAHVKGAVDVTVTGVATLSNGYTYGIVTIKLPPVPVTSAVAGSGGPGAAGSGGAAQGGSGGALMQLDYQKWLMQVKQAIEAVPSMQWSSGSIVGPLDPSQIPQLPFTRITLGSPRLLGRTSDGSGPAEEIQVAALLTLANGVLGLTGVPSGYTIGDLLYADSDHSLALLSDVAAGSYLRAGGVATAPLWSTLTLPNAASSGDILKASGANALAAVAPAALTKTDDTNVTLTLGGAATTALVNAASIVVGWLGQLGLGRGGTAADLSATGGAAQVLKQATLGGAVTVGTIPASDIASGAALTKADDTNVTLTLGGTPASGLLKAISLTLGWAGLLGLARGGTNANLSATGGTSQVLKQVSVGAAVTVAQLAASDLSNGTQGSGAVVLATSPTIATAALGSSTATTQAAGDNSTKLATTAYADAAAWGTEATVTTTGTINDLNFSNASLLRMNNATAATINGLVAGVHGQCLTIVSVGAGQVNLAHQNAGSTAANRLINFLTGFPTPLAAGTGAATLRYDATTARWRLVDHEQGAPITIAYASGNFTADAGTWTVDAGDQTTFTYFFDGTRCQISLVLSTTSIAGGPPTALQVALPMTPNQSGFTVVRTVDNAVNLFAGLLRTVAADPTLRVYKDVPANTWSASVNNTFVQGSIFFGVT